MAAEKPSPHELQAIQEHENAERLGNEDSARAAEKRLAASRANRVETAAAQRKQAASESTDAKPAAPQGRRAPGKQQA